MPRRRAHSSLSAATWELARHQYGVASRRQLLELGLSSDAIEHRVATGRLHPVARGIYAVGRPELSRQGLWTVAVLSCGPAAVLSHQSAGALWGIRPMEGGEIEVTVPPRARRRRPGIKVHYRLLEPGERVTRGGIPVTTAPRTLLDLATQLQRGALERAINEADKLDLIDPDSLRSTIDRYSGRPGVATLRTILDRHTFALTDSQLERRFLSIVRRAGLPLPRTGPRLNGFAVDFHWPDLGLVVETDGLRYHRTPGQQARDRLRDQAHAAAGLTPLRFTHAQVYYEPEHVRATLIAVVARIEGAPRSA